MLEALSNFFGAVKEFFGFRREQAIRENTPEMQAAAKGAQDQTVKDGAAKAIANQDIEQLRKNLAE